MLALCGIALLPAALAVAGDFSLQLKLVQAEASLAQARMELTEAGQDFGNLEGLALIRPGIELDKDPGYAPIRRIDETKRLQRQYADGFRALKFTPDQIDTVEGLLYERSEAARDARIEALHESLTVRDTAEAVRCVQSAFDREIVALIGAAHLKVLEEYGQLWSDKTVLASFRQTVADGFGTDLAKAGLPLSLDQVGFMAQIYFDAARGEQPRIPLVENPDPKNSLLPAYQTFLDRATPMLSGGQIAVIREFFVEETRRSVYIRNLLANQRAKSLQKENENEAVEAQREIIRQGLKAATAASPTLIRSRRSASDSAVSEVGGA